MSAQPVTPATAPQPAAALHMLPLARIKPSPMNPRKRFDQAALKDLAESIKAQGVRQPIVVRPLDTRDWVQKLLADPAALQYEIVVGERRWRASKLAGKGEIPALVQAMSNAEALEVMLIENLQREDVHPLDEALGYQALLQKSPEAGKAKHTVETIAAKVGKSVSYVYQRLKLADLVPEVQKLFQEDFLTAGHAIDIARLQPADQKRALEYCRKGGYGVGQRSVAPSVRELRRWIQENVHLDLAKAPFDVTDAKLVPSTGACTTCPKRTGSNPMLFEGLGKDTCTDPQCYQAKKMALVHVQVDKLEAQKGMRPVAISSEWCYDEKSKRQPGVLYDGDYRDDCYRKGKRQKIAPNSCKAARLAVWIDGDQAGKSLWVCTDPRGCKMHSEFYDASSGRSMARDDMAAARRAQRISKHYRLSLFQVLANQVGALAREDWNLLACELFAKLGHYQETPMIAALGWNSKLGEWNGQPRVRKHFAGMPLPELQKHLLLMACASDLVPEGMYHSGAKYQTPLLTAVAARHGVDPAAYLALAKAKFAPKKTKAKVQTWAKAKAKPKSKGGRR